MKKCAFPIDLVKEIIKNFPVNNFVETGTSNGYSLLEAAKYFSSCFSVELYEGRLSPTVMEQINELGRPVQLLYGDSVHHLPNIIKRLNQQYTVFWLDARYSGITPAAEGVVECPIMEELEKISKHEKAVILIDAKNFLGKPPYPHDAKRWISFQQLFNLLQKSHPFNFITLVDDFILSAPSEMRKNFDDYWEANYNKKYEVKTEYFHKDSLIGSSEAIYINLEKDIDRNERIKVELKRVGIKASRFAGLLPEQCGDISKLKKMQRQKGAVGCFFSHTGAMSLAMIRNKHAFIMEDDLVFCDDMKERMEIAEEFLKGKDWDIFWLGGTYHSNPPKWHDENHSNPDLPNCDCKLGRDVELTSNPRIVKTYGIWSTYAYIINKNSLVKIMMMLSNGIEDFYSIDHAFISLQPKLNTYAFVPAMVKQYDSKSNIQDGVMKFSTFSSLGAYWFAEKMNDVDPSSINWAEARLTK